MEEGGSPLAGGEVPPSGNRREYPEGRALSKPEGRRLVAVASGLHQGLEEAVPKGGGDMMQLAVCGLQPDGPADHGTSLPDCPVRRRSACCRGAASPVQVSERRVGLDGGEEGDTDLGHHRQGGGHADDDVGGVAGPGG